MKNFKAYLSTILRSEYFLLFLITVAAFLLRLHLLRYRFFPEGDGCHYVAIAKDFINGNFSTVGCHFIGWPFVITGFSLILENIEFSGRIASTILGTFLIPVSYVFAKKLFNRKIAFYTALLVSTNLSLLHYSTLLWPTSAHSLFVMLIALLGWVSLKEKRPFYYFLLGLVIAVSYTIRNEALVYILLFLPLVIIRDYRKAHINVLSLLSGILIVILPLLFFYHNQYGSWEIIRQKGMVNFLYGRGALSYRNVTELTVDFSQNLYMHKANGSFHEAPLKYFFNNFFINRLALNFKEILSDLPKQFFFTKFGGIFISWSLFIYGSYICLLGNRSLRRRYLYILSVPMLAYFVVSLGYMELRKIVPFIPFFYLIISFGISRLEMFFKSWVKYIFYLLLIIIYMISSVQAFDGAKQNRYSRPVHELQIEAGVWMRENVAQEGKLIVAEPIIPYFFYKKTPNNYERLPYGEYKSLVDYMKFSKSKYLAIFSWMREDNPAVNFLFNHNDPVELQLLKSLNKDSHTVLIYELGNENLTTEKSMTGINEN